MKKRSLSIMLAFLFGMFLFTSCSKDGPAGPQGENGAPGAPGAKGPAGPAGPAGTANVIYSDWLDVTFTDGLAIIGNITKLNADILNKGDIKVYVNFDIPSDPFVVPLPCSLLNFDDNNNPIDNIEITPYYYLNTIQLESNYNVSTVTTPEGKKLQFRYVLIPGGISANASINWNNYEEVKNVLQLQD